MCAVLLAGIPAKDAIPGQGAALLPEMSDRAFWNHCVDPRLRSQIIALGDKVPVSGPVLPGEELYMAAVPSTLQIAGTGLPFFFCLLKTIFRPFYVF